MLEKQLLGNRYVIDINVAAIYLVENHLGNKYVTELLDHAIESKINTEFSHFLERYLARWAYSAGLCLEE